MNAGIGGKGKALFTISEYVTCVKVWNKSKEHVEWITKDKCAFSHRCSIFKDGDYIVLGAELVLPEQTIADSVRRIKTRSEYCKANQTWGRGCFGSLFSEYTGTVLKVIAAIQPRHGGISFANKNKNWLVNDGNGTFEDVYGIINVCQKVHKLIGRPCKCEVIIWR